MIIYGFDRVENIVGKGENAFPVSDKVFYSSLSEGH